MIDRANWLIQIQSKTEQLYDHFAPLYWVAFGLQPNETHLVYLQQFLNLIPPHSSLLSAGCGAGRYDGLLLEAGHRVLGIDLSEGMLNRARAKFPEIRYEKKGLTEIDYHNSFEGLICIDTMEHIFPEDWPNVIHRFREALKVEGILYFTLDVSAANILKESYKKAKSKGLPVVYGEVAEEVDVAYEQLMALPEGDMPDGELADKGVYHYHPPLSQVRKWLADDQFEIVSEGQGKWYRHFIVRKV